MEIGLRMGPWWWHDAPPGPMQWIGWISSTQSWLVSSGGRMAILGAGAKGDYSAAPCVLVFHHVSGSSRWGGARLEIFDWIIVKWVARMAQWHWAIRENIESNEHWNNTWHNLAQSWLSRWQDSAVTLYNIEHVESDVTPPRKKVSVIRIKAKHVDWANAFLHWTCKHGGDGGHYHDICNSKEGWRFWSWELSIPIQYMWMQLVQPSVIYTKHHKINYDLSCSSDTCTEDT